MSLLPYFADPFFNDSFFMGRPSRIMNQNFGTVLDPEDLLQPIDVANRLLRCPGGYLRNWMNADSDSGSTVSYGKDQFAANLDVQHFKPEEISVKVTGDNTVQIEGKHDEKADEHGHIYRHFIRSYTLPENYDTKQIQSKLSSDGVLSITAPRVDAGQTGKEIPVIQTGNPAILEKKGKDENKKGVVGKKQK